MRVAIPFMGISSVFSDDYNFSVDCKQCFLLIQENFRCFFTGSSSFVYVTDSHLQNLKLVSEPA